MKSFSVILVLLMLFSSCKNETSHSKEKSQSSTIVSTSLSGTWELTGFYNYIDNKVVDSFNTVEGYRQVKIYTPTKVMWCKQVPSDSTEWFGYGNYRIEGDNLIEVLDYGSEMMSKIIQERKEFVYELDMNKNTFSQIELDESGNRIYSENYKRIE